ncbi:hypothetical protein ACXZ66_03280 [Corynebacterium sp. S7]
MESTPVSKSDANNALEPDLAEVPIVDAEGEYSSPSVVAPLLRVVGIFLLLTVWAVFFAIAYAYNGRYGVDRVDPSSGGPSAV